MPERTVELQNRVALLERETARLRKRVRESRSPGARAGRHSASPRPIRKRSATRLFGLPLWEIASGPEIENGKRKPGHARAIFAVGDIADGVFALGGIARGVVSVGGIAFGALSLGGVSISLLAAMGGVAIAPLAFGGAAIGAVAVGGAAVGFRTKKPVGSSLPAPVRRLIRPARLRRAARHWLP